MAGLSRAKREVSEPATNILHERRLGFEKLAEILEQTEQVIGVAG